MDRYNNSDYSPLPLLVLSKRPFYWKSKLRHHPPVKRLYRENKIKQTSMKVVLMPFLQISSLEESSPQTRRLCSERKSVAPTAVRTKRSLTPTFTSVSWLRKHCLITRATLQNCFRMHSMPSSIATWAASFEPRQRFMIMTKLAITAHVKPSGFSCRTTSKVYISYFPLLQLQNHCNGLHDPRINC